MRLTCGHDDEEGFVCGRCVSEALKALDEARRGLIARSTPQAVPLEEDCTRCVAHAAEAARLAEGYLEALDRLGAIRRLQVALKASQWEDEVAVAGILEKILDANGDDLKGLPGPFWTEPMDVRRVS